MACGAPIASSNTAAAGSVGNSRLADPNDIDNITDVLVSCTMSRARMDLTSKALKRASYAGKKRKSYSASHSRSEESAANENRGTSLLRTLPLSCSVVYNQARFSSTTFNGINLGLTLPPTGAGDCVPTQCQLARPGWQPATQKFILTKSGSGATVGCRFQGLEYRGLEAGCGL